MEELTQKIASLDWQEITGKINENGFARVPGMLSAAQCQTLISHYDDAGRYRKVITMARYRFGLGEYKYFTYPLPAMVQTIRENIYPVLAPLANSWMKMLGLSERFPDSFPELQRLCHAHSQINPTPLILRYGKGGYNALHQDLYGEIFFPLQAVLFLNQPEEDYTGGEFVLVQQIPRAQSKAMVLRPMKGDLLIFTTNFRPAKGTRGYYRVGMKHGVSEVHEGERHTLGIIFHDASN
jgi:hypothetical protein